MLLKLRNRRILKGAAKTYMETNSSSGDGTLTVLSDENFSGTNKYVLIGEFADGQSELIAFTSATGNVLTLGANTAQDHPKGTPVYLIQANQVDFYRSATIDGTYTTLAKVDIFAESDFTYYDDTANTTGFAKPIFYNSGAAANYGSFYEIIKYSGSVRKTRGFVKDVAVDEMNAFVDDDLTEDYLDRQIIVCDEILRDEKIKWKEETYELSVQSEVGITEYDLSSYVKDDDTISSILLAKMGKKDITPILRDDMADIKEDAVKTTLAVAITATTDTTITLTDSGDFADDGDILIEGDSISYTDNNRTTNVLSGVTEISATHAITSTEGADMEVWQGADTGKPDYLTIVDGVMKTYPVIDDTDDDLIISLDIAKIFDAITLDSDELAFPSYLYISYLKYAIARKRGDGDLSNLQTEFWGMVNKHKKKDISPVNRNFTPTGVFYNSSRRGRISGNSSR